MIVDSGIGSDVRDNPKYKLQFNNVGQLATGNRIMKFESNDLSNDELRAAYQRFGPSDDALPNATNQAPSRSAPTPPEPTGGDEPDKTASLTDALSGAAAPETDGATEQVGQPSPAPTDHSAGGESASQDYAGRDARSDRDAPQPSAQQPVSKVTSRHATPPAPDPANPPARPASTPGRDIPTVSPDFDPWSHRGQGVDDAARAGRDPQPPRPPAEPPASRQTGATYTQANPADRRSAPGSNEPPSRWHVAQPPSDRFNPPTGPLPPLQGDRGRPPRPAELRPPAGWPTGAYQDHPARPPEPADAWGHNRSQPAFPQPGDYAAAPRSGDHFTPDRGIDAGFTNRSQRREGPQQGWRGALHRLHIPITKGDAEIDYDLDIAKINKVIRYAKVIGFASPKGGVGKTVCAMAVGSSIAAHRQNGGVVAIDTDHSGSLARRVAGDQRSHIKRFVSDENLSSANDVVSHMQSNHHRLSVLGSSWEPLEKPLTPDDYLRALKVLQAGHLFTVVDMDTSAASPAYETIMRSLDALVIVTATSLDSAKASQDMLNWMRARGLTELHKRTVVLINHQSPAKPYLDLDETVNHFRNNESLEVSEIPWDDHLAEAGPINLDLLNKATRRQFVKVAARLVDSLPAS
jgi:MinD-like ATPase involved in chromosome partitioning or flagellar assembly